ncbi:Heat shock protein Hsp70 [Metarhizium rileyi]|uniref:Heat shock protein Hsp70 n=1 Tax=Metarhizium rileyi (strain RCEF 4871) TaxID=1649241 RepID=A0A167DNP7_METRR|nr:Heat shock protein Hsp70 [Metarhizium rileyi RCEF 4871]
MDEFIIIGIDFGTTYSGMAWAYSNEPEDIEVVTTWNSELSHCSDLEKTPTRLYLGKEDDDIKWGYAVPQNVEALEWFKLLLLKEKDMASEIRYSSKIQEARRLQEASKKGVVDVVACFLKQLWKHGLQSIGEAIGEDLLEKCILHVVMTLPAIWPHYAQESMKKAAQEAGILGKRHSGETVLRFISEPEAAALATIKDHSKKSTIQTGDHIVVCDAGGGTVDLISYQVYSKKPFLLKECVKGDGGLCGGIFLDEKFKEFVMARTCDAMRTLDKARFNKFLNDNWEHGIKPQFRGHGQNRSWGVELPNAVVTNGKGKKRASTLEISTPELVDVFRPVVDKVQSLVRYQAMSIVGKYGKEPKFIVLVGGFGRSPYLFEQLKLSAGNETAVLQSRGSRPWVAICRGAVIHGITTLGLSKSLNVKVKTRVARMSYGIEISEYFDPSIHSDADWYIDSHTLRPMAEKQMRWFIRQGQDLSKVSSVRQTFWRKFGSRVGPISEGFCVSASPEPPSRRDRSVSELCKVNWDKKINFDSLPVRTNSLGGVYRSLEFEVEITCDGTSIDFAVFYMKERVAQTKVQVKYS